MARSAAADALPAAVPLPGVPELAAVSVEAAIQHEDTAARVVAHGGRPTGRRTVAFELGPLAVSELPRVVGQGRERRGTGRSTEQQQPIRARGQTEVRSR